MEGGSHSLARPRMAAKCMAVQPTTCWSGHVMHMAWHGRMFLGEQALHKLPASCALETNDVTCRGHAWAVTRLW